MLATARFVSLFVQEGASGFAEFISFRPALFSTPRAVCWAREHDVTGLKRRSALATAPTKCHIFGRSSAALLGVNVTSPRTEAIHGAPRSSTAAWPTISDDTASAALYRLCASVNVDTVVMVWS